jgi:hypothetical protein
MDLKDHIRGIPDFPKPGIFFYDISTLLRDADAWWRWGGWRRWCAPITRTWWPASKAAAS